MDELLELAFLKVAAMPQRRRKEVAAALIDLADSEVNLDDLPDDHRAAISRGLADVEAGRVYSEEEMDAFFARLKAS